MLRLLGVARARQAVQHYRQNTGIDTGTMNSIALQNPYR